MVPTPSPASEPPPEFVTMTVSGAGFDPPTVALKPTLSAEKAITGRGTTSSTAVAVRALDAAVMVSRPSASPFATPVAETVATTGLRVDQAVGAPMKACPLWSRATAWRNTESPSSTTALSGEMARDAAGGGVMRRSSVQAAPATSAPSSRRRRVITLLESRDVPAVRAVLQRGAEAHGLILVRAALEELISAGDVYERALAAHVRVLHVQGHLEIPDL